MKRAFIAGIAVLAACSTLLCGFGAVKYENVKNEETN